MSELRERVEARRAKLERDLAQLKVETAGKVNAQVERLERHLSRVEEDLRQGWEHVSEQVARRLSRWVKGRDA